MCWDAAECAARWNLTSPYNSTMGIKYPREATVLASVCAIIFIVVGVIGNSVTAAALLLYPKLRGHATTMFVLSLCVSDLLFCGINLPLTAARYMHERWTLGHELCQLFPFMFYGNEAVSLLSMVAITINRYILIAYYDRYAQLYTTTRIWVQLVAIWLVSFGLMIPPTAGVWGQLGLDDTTFSCTILKDSAGRSPKKFLFVFGFALPCLVIIGAYSCIYCTVRDSKRKLEGRSKLSGQSVKEKEEDSRLTTLMLTIFLCFLACFLPLMIMNVADVLCCSKLSGQSVKEKEEDSRLTTLMLTIFLCFLACFLPLMIMNVADVLCCSKLSGQSVKEKEEDSRLTTLMLTIFLCFLACFLPLMIMNVADVLCCSKLSGQSVKEKEEDSRLTTLMLTIFLCFLACFLPLMIMNVADVLCCSKLSGQSVKEKEEDSRLTTLMLTIFLCFLACFLPLMIMNVADVLCCSKLSGQSVKEKEEDSRLTTLMLTIFLCFLACFLPLMIMNVADDSIRFPWFHVIASILAWASSVINPVIYAVTNRQYRAAYRHLLASCGARRAGAAGSGARRATWGSRTAPGAAPVSSNNYHSDRRPTNTNTPNVDKPTDL